MVTIKDVARQAGVTPSVVSRMLNGDPTLRVRPETRERVSAAVADLNYTPNRAARALRRSRTGALGIVLRHLTSPVYAEIFSAAEEEAGRSNYVTFVAEADTLAGDEARMTQLLNGSVVDGLLLQRDGTPSDDVLVKGIERAGLPMVLLNERAEAPQAGVGIDDAFAARLATRHLLELGHKEIAFLEIGDGTSRDADRRAGWEMELHAAGEPWRPGLVALAGRRADTGYQQMAELLGRGPKPPTGVVAGTLLSAIGAMSAIRASGLRVPEDVSVIGHHDGWFAEYSTPPLTVVRGPLRELGIEAVRLLCEQIEGQPARQVVLGEPKAEIVVRGSTGPPSR